MTATDESALRDAGTTASAQLAGWASALRFEDLPPRVVAYAKSQLMSELSGARIALRHSLGRRVVHAFGPPLADDPARSAVTLAALTMCLEFDDTVYAGHVSHSSVNVPVAYARAAGLDGRGLLTAIVAATECAARITASATIGPFRGQTASHPHLAGAVAGRLKAEGAPARQWVDALGIAFTLPPWSLLRGLLGSDAKVMTAAAPVRAGIDACDAAAAGLRGPEDIFEHHEGFLARFSTIPLPEEMTFRLGERWHTESLSFKLWPASTGIYAAVECGVDVARQLGGLRAEDVEEVVVHGSIFTFLANARTMPYLTGPEAPVSALQFAVPYALATALLRGDVGPEDYEAPAVDDPERWALAAKVRVEHDERFSELSLTGTSPLGEALRQAGERGVEWLSTRGVPEADALVERMGPPSPTFERALKTIGSRVVVKLRDGREVEAARDTTLGAANDDTRARHPELLRAKLASTGASDAVVDVVGALEEASPAQVEQALEEALALP